ncbi:gamma-glutamylcyclotransferase, partial [Bradyrhizobium lupini]|uniref:gamma-glutamylcyclotransferase n=1 Tax=Rhizobium lupini TaxID=136996 RepID=UPI00387E12B6
MAMASQRNFLAVPDWLDAAILISDEQTSGNFDLAWDMDDFWVFGYGSLMWNPASPSRRGSRRGTVIGARSASAPILQSTEEKP